MKWYIFLVMFLIYQITNCLYGVLANVPPEKAFMNAQGYMFCLAVFILMLVIDVVEAKDRKNDN